MKCLAAEDERCRDLNSASICRFGATDAVNVYTVDFKERLLFLFLKAEVILACLAKVFTCLRLFHTNVFIEILVDRPTQSGA